VSVWLSKTHNQDTVVHLASVLCKPLICCNQQSAFFLCHFPENIIINTLIFRAADIQYMVTHLTQSPDGHQRYVFVNKNFHVQHANASTGVTCSSASDAVYSRHARMSSRVMVGYSSMSSSIVSPLASIRTI